MLYKMLLVMLLVGQGKLKCTLMGIEVMHAYWFPKTLERQEIAWEEKFAPLNRSLLGYCIVQYFDGGSIDGFGTKPKFCFQ